MVARFLDMHQKARDIHARTLWTLKTKTGSFVVGGTTAIGKHIIYRWDTEFLSPYNGAAYFAAQRIGKAFSSFEVRHKWEPRSALLVDNWNCTHSRGEGDDQKRRLLRLEAWHYAGMDN